MVDESADKGMSVLVNKATEPRVSHRTPYNEQLSLRRYGSSLDGRNFVAISVNCVRLSEGCHTVVLYS